MPINNISRENIVRLDTYIKTVSRGLSHIEAEYEKELIQKYRNSHGKPKERLLAELVSYNIRILAEIAITVLNSIRGGNKIDPLDLMQVGVVTIMKKLNTWTSTKKAKFITYYYRDVKTQMQRFVMNNAFDVRQGSVFLQHLAYSISRLNQRALTETGKEHSIEKLSEELGFTEETIRYCMRITSVQTLPIEENWVMYKIDDELDSYYEDSPLQTIIKRLAHRIDPEKSSIIHKELYAFLEKQGAIPLETLTKLRNEKEKNE
jgi:DNA-directed RNA polymerase sigma subunit (sigma70/sigma32)